MSVHRLRRRGAISIERTLGLGVGLAVIVGVLGFFWVAWGAFQTQSAARMATMLVTEVRQAHRMSGQGMPDPVGMASYLRASDAVPSDLRYSGSDPACAVEAPWGGCVEMWSDVTGDAEYLTMAFHDIPRRICTRFLTFRDDGSNAIGGMAVAAETRVPGEDAPRRADVPNPRDAAAGQCRSASVAVVTLMWPK